MSQITNWYLDTTDRLEFYKKTGRAVMKEIARKPEYLPLAAIVGIPKIRRPIYHILAATVTETVRFKQRLLKAQVANVFNQKKIRKTKLARGLQGAILAETVLFTAPIIYEGAKMKASASDAGFIML